ncbi:DUF6537 domain-containing protein [Streptomyces sp. NPDC058665]|uniref:DUF6537 domain-containing protein n=1 Tax=Streptomyces sp. NPDC058665 TaxID=3346586 RepID=UPI00364AFB0F
MVAYQNRAYASRFTRTVEAVSRREEQVAPGSRLLTDTVARNLFKLMAYKDEYEVARLCSRPGLADELAAEFGPGSRAVWRLHPPMFRALGVERKISLGPWFRPVFRALYAARVVRGTPFDPFGRAHVRRVERALLTEYEALVLKLVGGLRNENVELAAEVAALPDLVRGYEEVKLTNVESYRAALETGLAKFEMSVRTL